MQGLDVGDLTERLKIKERFQCYNFSWYITNVWPELAVFDHNALAWGSVSVCILNSFAIISDKKVYYTCFVVSYTDEYVHLLQFPQFLLHKIYSYLKFSKCCLQNCSPDHLI